MPKVSKNENLAYELRKQGKTLQEIGDALGCTRERARQLLQCKKYKEGLGPFKALSGRSVNLLRNLGIRNLEDLALRWHTFKRSDGNYNWRGCGVKVYSELESFLKSNGKI